MDLNIEETTLKHQIVNVPTEYNILSNRILSIYIFEVNYSWVSNLGEGKLRFLDFSVSIFNFCTKLTEK